MVATMPASCIRLGLRGPLHLRDGSCVEGNADACRVVSCLPPSPDVSGGRQNARNVRRNDISASAVYFSQEMHIRRTPICPIVFMVVQIGFMACVLTDLK